MPCHMAVGLISEDRQESGLKRGNKVILNPYVVMHTTKTRFAQKPKYTERTWTAFGGFH